MLGRLPSSQLRADKPFCDPASLSGNPLVSGRSPTNDNPIVSLTGSSDISDCCPCQFKSHFECTSGKIAGGAIAISYGLPRLLADTNRQRGNKFLKQASAEKQVIACIARKETLLIRGCCGYASGCPQNPRYVGPPSNYDPLIPLQLYSFSSLRRSHLSKNSYRCRRG